MVETAVTQAEFKTDARFEGLDYHEALNAVGISGGIAGNVIPDRCVVSVNYRYAPDRDTEAALDHLREVFDGYELTLSDAADAPAASAPSAVASAASPCSASSSSSDALASAAVAVPTTDSGNEFCTMRTSTCMTNPSPKPKMNM